MAFSQHVTDYTKDIKVLSEKLDDIKKTPRRVAQALGALILAGAALTNILTYISNQEVSQKAGQAAQAASAAATTSATATKTIGRKLDAVVTATGAQTNAAGP